MERSGKRVSKRATAMRTAWLFAASLASLCALSHRTLAQGPGVAGRVRYYSNDALVPDAVVQLSGPAGAATTTTDASGAYAFSDPGQASCTIAPRKSGGTNGAISVLDASWILQAVVGLRQFSPNQALACDVTGDGTVSSLDAARILQYIAGVRGSLPVADACGSDWVFVPAPAGAPGQQIIPPQVAPMCSAGAIGFDGLTSLVDAQDFLAIVFGDCTGNWQPASPTPTSGDPGLPTETPVPTSTGTPPPPTATPAPTDTPLPTTTASATATASATFSAPPNATATRTATVSATPTRTGTATRTATPSVTATPTRTPPATGTQTRTVTLTGTATNTATATPTWTPLATSTQTRTVTRTWTVTSTVTTTPTFTPLNTSTQTRTFTVTPTITATRTATFTSTATITVTPTPTRTGTRTTTPTSTFTPSPTPTATCAHGLAWTVSSPTLVSSQSGGNLWLAKSVPTDFGWGLFWLRQDPSATNSARLYYAHVDFSGQITVGPLLVTSVPRIAFRGHYYFVAWNQDHYGLALSNQATLYYYNLSLDGVLSGLKTIPVPLFTSTEFDQESDGDLDAFPGGFVGVVEGECAGHSCSYAYKLDVNGNSLTSPVNLVDFDFTHQFYPHAAFDGAGFAIISVKDIQISTGGVMTKYWPPSGAISSNAKVVPAKEYLWDEFPDVAFNGDHFSAVWTENSARSDTAPWQIHFATFRRTKTASTYIADRVVDSVAQKTNQRWTTQVHAVGADWVAQYGSRAADGSIVAVYELLGDDAQTRAALEPFTLSADALGSSPHFAAGHVGELGIVRGSNLAQGTEVTFQTLPPPACAP
jgi:hypothetical protein